jgi:hypothetical protein
MRYCGFFILLVVSITTKSQTYSSVISDFEIVDFINKDLAKNFVKKESWINPRYWKPHISNYYYKDSADRNSKLRNPHFLFKPNTTASGIVTASLLDSILSRKDIDFFKEQIEGLLEGEDWKDTFQKAKIVSNPPLDKNGNPKQVVEVYSIPIFSFDRQHVILMKGFYCGLLCGYGGYHLYKRSGEDWVVIRILDEWGE